MHEEQFQAMRQSIIDGAADHASELATQALALGIDPLAATNQGYVPGLSYTGELFSKGQAFLPELVMATL